MVAYIQELIAEFEAISLSIVVAFVLTTLFIWILRPLAIRLGLVDHPNHRKQHIGSIPLIGGVSMYLGFVFAILTLNISLRDYRSFLAGAGLLVIVGILDDFHELTPRKKFVAQVIAILLMISWGGVMITDLGDIIPGVDEHVLLGSLSWPVTFIMAIAIINAINMSDGVDGLAGGYVSIALIGMLVLTVDNNAIFDTRILLLLIAAISAFLVFNMRTPWRKKAHVFMGDAGSMFLGFVLTWFVITLTQNENSTVKPITVLWLIALPAFDLVEVTLRRILEGKHAFHADRSHIHHYFMNIGFSAGKTSWILLAIATLFAATGILLQYFHIVDSTMFLGYMGLFVAYFFLMRYLWGRVNDTSESEEADG